MTAETLTKPFFVCLALMSPAQAATFHIAPEGGSMDNPGTSSSPWSTLEQVFATGKISTRKPANYPYRGGELVAKNPAGPVLAGDTLLLYEGYHGVVDVREYYNEDTIFVRAAPGQAPRLGWVHLRSVSRWKLSGLTISPSFAPEFERQNLLRFEGHGHSGPSSHCVAESCTLFTVPNISAWTESDWNGKACNGIELGGDHMTARGNILRNVNFGISSGGDSVLVQRNQVINFSGDGLRGLGDHQVWEYNLVKNCYNVNANHDDGFQSWSSGPDGVGTGEVVGMVLRGNTFLNYEDADQPFRGTLQGIGCFDGMFRDWIIENNVIITDHWHGLTLMGAIDCRVVNNTVVDINNAKPGPSWISITSHKNGTLPSGNLVANNLATSYSLADKGVEAVQNVTLAFADYGLCFRDFAGFDLRLKAGCPAVGAASVAHAPSLDILGSTRPRGEGPDAGAYEFPDSPTGKVSLPTKSHYDNSHILRLPLWNYAGEEWDARGRWQEGARP